MDKQIEEIVALRKNEKVNDDNIIPNGLQLWWLHN